MIQQERELTKSELEVLSRMNNGMFLVNIRTGGEALAIRYDDKRESISMVLKKGTIHALLVKKLIRRSEIKGTETYLLTDKGRTYR